MMTLTKNNATTTKLSITENKEQYVQTINNLKLIKILRKKLKNLECETIYAIYITNTTNSGSCAVIILWHKYK